MHPLEVLNPFEWRANNRIYTTLNKAIALAKQDYPQLEPVKVLNKPQHGTTGSFSVYGKEGEIDNIAGYQYIFQLSQRATNYKRVLKQRPDLIKHEVELLGIPENEYTQHLELSAAFTTFHELGHGKQAIDEYAAKGISVRKLEEQNTADRESLLPIPTISTADIAALIQHPRKNRRVRQLVHTYMHEHGIKSKEEVLHLQEVAYKQTSSEVYADTFAKQCMQQFWKELGFDKLTQIESI